jgi:contact-dependent growth inhibition (CDI) system CdiI-like immunity protein
MFSIGFTDEPLEYPYDDTNIPAAPGRLVLGKSTEEFLANLAVWAKSEYESHWTRELKSLLEGNPKVALIVSYYGSRASNMEIWRAYRDGELVHFQNQILWYGSLPHAFEVLKLSQYIQDREVVTAEGNRISEWDVAIRDIELFLGAHVG